MRRYWVSPNKVLAPSRRVIIDGDVFHHIFGVCRQEIGSQFELITGESVAYLVEVDRLDKKSAEAKILDIRGISPLPRPHIHLAISFSRFHVMDSIVERAVEMGVHSIHPFFSDQSFIRQNSHISEGKLERWRKIVISATQQCGRGELMSIASPDSLDNLLKGFGIEGRFGLFSYEGDAQRTLREELQKIPLGSLKEIWIFVGSEGGFSFSEVQKFRFLGMEPITLGPQVLRVETACIALLAILRYESEF